MDQTVLLEVTSRERKSICDAVTVIWWMAPQGITVYSHCSHWGGRRNLWVRRLCCSWLSYSCRDTSTWPSQHQAGKAQLGALAGDVHMQDTSTGHLGLWPHVHPHRGGRPPAAVIARIQGFSMHFQKMSLHMYLNKPGTATQMFKLSFDYVFILLNKCMTVQNSIFQQNKM